MSTTRRGISAHARVEIYEVMHQMIRRAGGSPRCADRVAVYGALRFAGLSRDEALEAREQILGTPQGGTDAQ